MPTEVPSNELRGFFDRRHPMYSENALHWAFLTASYRGGRSWFKKNLFQYVKEGNKEYTDRLERSYRFNHTREVVDLVNKYLFKGVITRNADKAPDSVQRFWKKSMLNGFDINQLIRQNSTKTSIGGRVALVVDNNMDVRVTEEGKEVPTSIADASDSRIYAYTVPVEDVLDYAWDEDGDGDLLWIKLREWFRDDADPIKSTGLTTERVRLWTRDGWVLYTEGGDDIDHNGAKAKKIDVIGEGVHDLGSVPVLLVDHTVSSEPYNSPGLIDDIAYLDRAVANYLSNLDAIIQDQTFSQLAIPAQSIQRGDDMYTKVVEMGTKRIFVYDSGQGSSAKPEFLSPDPKQAGVILTVINKIINEIYHTVGLAGERTKEDNAVGIDNSSGVAKAYDFERVNSLLLSKAAACQRAENWLTRMVQLWSGETPVEDDLVTYPDTFDVMRLVDDLVTAAALKEVDAPVEMRREQMRLMVDKLFPQLKDDILKKIRADIDKWTPTPEGAQIATPEKPAADKSRQGSVTKDTK